MDFSEFDQVENKLPEFSHKTELELSDELCHKIVMLCSALKLPSVGIEPVPVKVYIRKVHQARFTILEGAHKNGPR